MRAFRLYLGCATAGTAGYFLLPGPVQNLALLGSNLLATLVILTCLRRRRLSPTTGWLLLAGFTAATGVGNAIYFVNDSLRHVSPFPSPGDGCFLGGYLLLAAGLLRMQRHRTSARDLSAVLDTAIITVGFAAASWVALVSPLLEGQAALLERLTALGYPVADVLVLAVSARFLLGSRRRGSVYGWLGAVVVVMLVADTVFALLNVLGLYETGNPVDALILTYNIGWGAVALHPDAGLLSAPPKPDAAERRPGWRRLAVLTAASLVAPAVMVFQVLTHRHDDLLVTTSAAAVLFLLVVGRMAGLVHQLEAVLVQRRQLEGELERRAHHDDLTGLANRRLFSQRVDASLAEHREGGTTVLFLDLDRFKAVNDSLGHNAGDTLLMVTAERLRAALSPEDTVARLGGDEFAVLLSRPGRRDVDGTVADVVTAVQVLVRLHGLDVHVSASVGSAMALPGQSLEDVLHRADTAMYTDKVRHERRAARGVPVARADQLQR